MKDQLVDCKRCGGNACYEQHINENTTTWLCMGCGFTTSTLMTDGSTTTATALETLPELHKVLMYVDENKNVWLPATITLPGKGMVFLDGNNKENWTWTAVNAIPITEEDRKVKSYPKDQTVKMDMANGKTYSKNDFMDALEQIGFYDIGE